MKKIKKVFLCMLLLLMLTGVTVSYGVQPKLEMNGKKEGKEYKNRDFDMGSFILNFNDEVFFNGENDTISLDQKNANNKIILIFCIILVIYWGMLLWYFEKEEPYEYTYENIDDIETLKKYNPMIAGCLVDNRQVLNRDVTAVVLNLIQKGVIEMEMIPNFEDGKENYKYMISENKGKIGNLDEIEVYILNWIFGYYEEEKVDLIQKLKELAQRKDFIKHIKHLNKLAEKKLYKIGANIPRVPLGIRKINIGLLMFSIVFAIIHIMNNGISIHIYQSTFWLLLLVAIGVVLILPIIAFIIHLILVMIVLIKKVVKNTAEYYSGKRMVQMSALILVTMFLLIMLIYAIAPNKYICFDIFMIGMAWLIVKTDNLMTKHNDEILNDYYALREVKYRIKEYSLIKDEQINYMKLWNEYLIYAVAFGIPIPIVNKLKETNQEDLDLKYLAQCENLYYICKAYLEVMWDMNFKEKTNIFNINNLFMVQKAEPVQKSDNDFIHKF